MRLAIASFVAALLASAGSAAAQDGAPLPADEAGDEQHGQPDSSIVVTGVRPEARVDALSGVAILQADELAQAIRPSIGETLAHTPGVSATSFGPSASRPILRGLQGERVRVLTDGIGAVDVSNTSADHATIVNPLLAERIEVLRGPQSLLYGSSAIGGVVNVIDRRIPSRVPDEVVHFDALATYGSAANERSASAAADAPLGGGFVLHADGSYARSDDLEIGGFVLSPAKRREALASGDPAIAANAQLRGRLPNTASKTTTGALGVAYIDDGGQIGVAYSRYDSLYGVPVRLATQAGQDVEAPRLDVAQDRIDARVELDLGTGFLEQLRFRYAYGDYRHFELEEDGAVGTAFYDQGMEGRLELAQAQRGAWSGALGGQFFVRDFDVVGEEAFLPKSSTGQLGLFTVQQFDLDRIKLEVGARYEHSTVEAKPRPDQPQFFAGERRFSVFSGSAGASYDLGGGWRIGANLSRTARPPAAEELFANGPHAGTEAFEIGDPRFATEKSWGGEAILRRAGDDWSLEASAYHTRFTDFIYQDLTGAAVDGLPVFQFRQADHARYYGFEVQGSATLARFGEARLEADALADYVHALIDGVGPAPRIPPLRLLGGIALKASKFDLRGEVERVTAQRRTSAFETPTAGFTLVNLEANLRPGGKDGPLALALSANNLFDVDARRHASVLKDFAPLAGRDLRVTARVEF
ncbi:MAG TPA: TonB-dependent receptor [Novosphingobium sp.]|nr:TonB-dependent receptor [Novosphingobium sp.]